MSVIVRSANKLGIAPQALWTAIAAAVFIAISTWWLLYDERTPGGGDPADHLATTLRIADLIGDLDLGSVIDLGYSASTDRFYPPLVPLVGSIAPLIGLQPHDWGTIAINLVFVPMLATGTYLAGRRIYNPTAGLLAALFALGTPIVGSLFHVFLLDAPLAATIAASFAALLACESFERRGPAVTFGALVGVALLVKTIAPVYLIGPVAVVLLRGGWRRWRNVALAALALLIVAGPYYAIHLSDALGVGEQTTFGSDFGATGPAYERDARVSFDNLTYYAWAAINEQYYVPLLCLLAVGAIASIRSLGKRRGIAELFAGIVVSYLMLAILLSFRDTRYTLPLVVFVAVLSTGWITEVRREWVRSAAIAVLAIFAAINVATSMVGWIPPIRLEPPGTKYEFGIDPGSFTVVEDRGYWVGPPLANPLWRRVFEAAERDGLDTVRLHTREQRAYWGADYKSLDVFGDAYGVSEVTVDQPRPYEPADLRVTLWGNDAVFVGEKGLPQPCGHVEEGAGFADGEPVTTSVLVERRSSAGYKRWCRF